MCVMDIVFTASCTNMSIGDTDDREPPNVIHAAPPGPHGML